MLTMSYWSPDGNVCMEAEIWRDRIDMTRCTTSRHEPVDGIGFNEFLLGRPICGYF